MRIESDSNLFISPIVVFLPKKGKKPIAVLSLGHAEPDQVLPRPTSLLHLNCQNHCNSHDSDPDSCYLPIPSEIRINFGPN